MRIGATTFGCDAGRSGIGRYAIQVLAAMGRAAAGDTIEVLAHAAERETFLPPGSPPALKPFVLPGLLTHPVADIAWHQAILPAWAAARRWDALFLPAGNRRLPAFAPCPTVGTVHDLAAFHVEAKYDAARMFYIRRVLPALSRRLDVVLTVSESSRRDLVELAGVDPARVVVTPLGVDHDKFRPEARAGGSDGRPPYVLYVSRIEHPGKNHVRLIRAFERMKARRPDLPHRLVLAGPDWTRADEVKKAAAASPVAAEIEMPGAVPGSALPGLYASADVFVFPSQYEVFGLPILEAMACGVPVACSNVSSMPEVAGDAAVLFDPADEDAISAALETAITDETGRTERVARGLTRAKGFTWDATARLTLQAIRAAAS